MLSVLPLFALSLAPEPHRVERQGDSHILCPSQVSNPDNYCDCGGDCAVMSVQLAGSGAFVSSGWHGPNASASLGDDEFAEAVNKEKLEREQRRQRVLQLGRSRGLDASSISRAHAAAESAHLRKKRGAISAGDFEQLPGHLQP